MSRLDKMRKIFEANASIDAAKPINPNAEKILKILFDKAIPMMAYYNEHDIEEAIFDDAIDEGLNAFDIYSTMPKLIELNKYNRECLFILIGVKIIAKDHLTFKRAADIARMNEIDDGEDQDEERINPKEE
jgi:hypothetical protein